MKINEILLENQENVMTLWHGGRGLEFSYQEMLPHKKGRWEHGPGLYLTTHYETAAKYAKGGGKVYEVTIRKGTNINDVTIDKQEAIDFIKKIVIKRLQPGIIENIERAAQRGDNPEVIRINIIVNLCLNYDALQAANTVLLRQFLVNHGVDYDIEPRFGGRNETVVIVYNPKCITKVKSVKASDVEHDARIRNF